MNQRQALKLLQGGPKGIAEWNRRRGAGGQIPDLNYANLSHADLSNASLSRANLDGADFDGANLSRANFYGADLSNADLSNANLTSANLLSANLSHADLHNADLLSANLSHADLSNARLSGANLYGADFDGANLSRANFYGANLSNAKLSNADLSNANLHNSNLSYANLRYANLHGAYCGSTVFANVDLSEARGLDLVEHARPSTIGIDTLFRSNGKIPEAFLRGCGVPESMIQSLPLILNSMEPIQFYSCFISYSHKDEEFAARLHSRMVQERISVWYAPEHLPWGEKLHEQIDHAIRVHDKLMLVLSAHSLASEWVKTEIRKAHEAQMKDGKRRLFPIRLVDFQAIRDWECFDADSGKDLGVEIREYIIPDFSNWKDHDSFESAFTRLIKSLKARDSASPDPSAPSSPDEKAT